MERIWPSFREVRCSAQAGLRSVPTALKSRLIVSSREAACRQQANEMNDAMNAFHNAAKSYKKSNPEGESSS
jgi:hypothetical protein